MSDWLGLTGQKALIAGAGTLGGALAQGFVEAGAEVAVADVSADRLSELAPGAGLSGDRLIAADLSSPSAARRAVESGRSALGGIDVFVHCVGINDRRPIGEYGPAEWDAILGVNLSSAFWTAQAALAPMRAAGHGRVIFFSSVAGLMGHRNHGPYAATKGALNQLTKVMAHEYAADGVTVNAVAPGYMDTNLTAAYLEAHPGRRDELISLIPAGRFGRLDEVVGPVLFLGSRHAGFINGHTLYVDGGRTVV